MQAMYGQVVSREVAGTPDNSENVPFAEPSKEEQAEFASRLDELDDALNRLIRKTDDGLVLLASSLRELREAREVVDSSNRRSKLRAGEAQPV